MIAGVVTTNDPIAERPPTSVAFTVAPDVPLGTSNVHVNAPTLFVVNEPLVRLELVIGTLSNSSDAKSLESVNPVPLTITVDPAGPCPGVTVIAGGGTVNSTGFVVVEVVMSLPTTL